MIDIKKLKYKVILTTEKGKQIDVSEATKDLGWEEGHGELAARIGATLHNTKQTGVLAARKWPGGR